MHGTVLWVHDNVQYVNCTIYTNYNHVVYDLMILKLLCVSPDATTLSILPDAITTTHIKTNSWM